MSTEPLRQEPVPQRVSEARLLELRRQAETRGRVEGAGVHPPGAPFPKASPDSGYYGIPLLKQPQWKWEVPLYFFVGGAAGSAVIGAMANWVGRDPELRRSARLVAAAGGMISTGLLVADLGRPSRFLNMLRVFKKRSAMSVGAWTLAAFSSFSGATAFAELLNEHFDFSPVRVLGHISEAFSAGLGLPFHNYTGVLIGATAIPVWNRNIATLPIHFGMSGLNSAVAILELMGHNNTALNLLGIGASAFETYEGPHLEQRREAALEPLKHGVSGWITRLGGVLSGPAPLSLRLAAQVSGSRKMRRAACWAAIAGSLLTRYGWMQAGKASAQDWRLPLETADVPELQAAPERPQPAELKTA
jgi:hypothetical protein